MQQACCCAACVPAAAAVCCAAGSVLDSYRSCSSSNSGADGAVLCCLLLLDCCLHVTVISCFDTAQQILLQPGCCVSRAVGVQRGDRIRALRAVVIQRSAQHFLLHSPRAYLRFYSYSQSKQGTTAAAAGVSPECPTAWVLLPGCSVTMQLRPAGLAQVVDYQYTCFRGIINSIAAA